jgi:hypothetical protein
MSAAPRLPSRFPAGTKFVVEGEDAAGGGIRIVQRYLVYPDGRQVDLLAGAPQIFVCGKQRAAGAARRGRTARHREERVCASVVALQ